MRKIRILAMLLSVAMLLSLFPVSVSADEENDKAIEVQFNNSAITAATLGKAIDNWTVAADAGWSFSKGKSNTNASIPRSVDASGIILQLYYSGDQSKTETWLNLGNNRKQMQFAIKVHNITAGWYDLSLSGIRLGNAGDYFVFANGQYAGYYNFNNARKDGVAFSDVKALNRLYLTPDADGNAEILFAKVCPAYLADNTRSITSYFKSLTLTPTSAPEKLEVKVVDSQNNDISDTYKISIGDEETLSVSALLDDKIFNYSGYDVNAGEDNSILSVEITGDSVSFNEDRTRYTDEVLNATLKTVKIGKSTLKVVANAGGKTVTKSIEVEVTEIPKLAKAELELSKTAIYPGQKSEATLVLTREDGKPYTLPYTVKWDSLNPSVATVSGGVIEGVEKGSATIEATVTAEDGTVVKGTAEIRVKDASEPVTVYFNNTTLLSSKTTFRLSETTMANNANWELIKGESNSKSAYHSFGENFVWLQIYNAGENDPDSWMSVSSKREMQFAFNIKDVAKGWYDITFEGDAHPKGTGVFIFAGGRYVGYYDGASGGSCTYKNAYLEPDTNGDVKVVLARTSTGVNRYIGAKSMTITPTIAPNETTLKLSDGANEFSEKITLPFGDSIKLFASAYYDESPVAYSGYTVEGTADNKAMSISLSGDTVQFEKSEENIADDTFDGTLKAVRLGTTRLTATAEIDGKTVSDFFEIEVTKAPELKTVSLTTENSQLYATRNTATSLDLIREDGKEYILPYAVTYTSSDENIATVSQEGVITGKTKGNAVITATVTPEEGTAVSGQLKIRVLDKPYILSITPKAESHGAGLMKGETTKIVTTGQMNDGEAAVMSDFTLTYESLNPDVATVDENGEVTAIDYGTAQIKVTATGKNGKSASARVKITVSDKLLYYFNNTTLDVSHNYTKPPQQWVVTADNWFLVPERTTTSPTNSINSQCLSLYMPGTVGWQEQTTTAGRRSMQFTISAKVEKEGLYKVGLCGLSAYYAGKMFIFADGQYAGLYDFHNDKGPESEVFIELNTLQLTPDENGMVEIMFAKADGLTLSDGSRSSNINPMYLSLRPVEEKSEFKDLVISKLPSVLAVGEIYTGGVGALLSDGTPYNFGVTSSGGEDAENKTLIELSGNAEAEEILPYTIPATGMNSFTIRGTQIGFATLRLGVKMGDMIIYTDEAGVKIEIVDDPIKTTGLRTEPADVCMGENAKLYSVNTLESGRTLTPGSEKSTFTSLNPEVATVSGNVLTPVSEGTAIIKVTTEFADKTVCAEVPVEVSDDKLKSFEVTAGGSHYIRYTGNKEDTVPLWIEATSTLGNDMDLSKADISARSLNPEYAVVDSDLNVIPVGVDAPNTEEVEEYATVKLEVSVSLDGRTVTANPEFTVVKGKNRKTLYTDAKQENIRKNTKKYDWANNAVEEAKEVADKYIDKLDVIYSLIHSEGIPRNYDAAGVNADAARVTCRYCRTDLKAKYGGYPWNYNPETRPWKVQCPDCKRLFPSNDFESFYKLGLNEYGEFDRMRALENHRAKLLGEGKIDETVTTPGKEYSNEWFAYYGYGIEGGFLYNELYKEIGALSNPADKDEPFLRPGETTARWAVDDGMGYVPTKSDGTPYMLQSAKLDATLVDIPERHTYIAAFLHNGLWYKNGGTGTTGLVVEAVKALSTAYYYTDDLKYGRPAAILLDRIADYYNQYDLNIYDFATWKTSDRCQGGAINYVWETDLVNVLMQAYDKVFDVFDDPYVIDYLKEKGEDIKFRYSKETGNQIRTHIEDNILREVLNSLDDPFPKVAGNWGMAQQSCAIGAVVLDTLPDTATWIDYLMKPGWSINNSRGGAIDETLVNTIDHDGYANEASRYQSNWFGLLYNVLTYLEDYDRYQAANFKDNPKFKKMVEHSIQLMSPGYTPQIGDTDYAMAQLHWATGFQANAGWKMYREPIYAQLIYYFNGNKTEGLRYGIEHENPELLSDEVQEVIDEYGTFRIPSNMLTGFGFAALRSGEDHSDKISSGSYENRHDVWMYFGLNGGHGHTDSLNLGMTAYGLNFMPELGYPEATGMQPKTLQWSSSTLSHNTVMVNKIQQNTSDARGQSYHFDDTEMVKLMDVDAKDVYQDIVEDYRRSVIMIKASDEISYTIDFFKVLGGDDHLYSFHATSNEVTETKGLDFTTIRDENGNYVSGAQVDENGKYKGTYQGIDVPYGPDPNSPLTWGYETVYPRGYTWVENVDRDISPDEKIEIDFAIKDFNKYLRDGKGLHLSMTILDGGNRNPDTKTQLAISDGYPTKIASTKNIDKFKYVFLQHSGSDLNTTFTTVFEPYRNERYLKAIDEVPMGIVAGDAKASESARALRIEHTSGRIDYVFYSTDNSVTYEIMLDNGEKLHFRGFVGVYTVQNGANTYKYLNDGDILETVAEGKVAVGTGTFAAIEGKVKKFTETLEEKNEIVITPNRTVSAGELSGVKGKYIYVDNGTTTRNGSYKIENAYLRGDDIVCELGNVTVIRQYINSRLPQDGYVYDIEVNQSARIPLTYTEANNPSFVGGYEGLTTSAGSSLQVNVFAESPLKESITYSPVLLPRGASLDASTGTLLWKPTASQVGEHHVAVTAADESGRETTLHFYITVYGSTTGSKTESSGTSDKTETPSTSTPSGGGGGGGAAPDEVQVDEETSDKEDDEKTDETTGENTENAPDASGETDTVRFTDLDNHMWAADAINALASDDIIKGTTVTTYSPESNITRADFALLLVRAFNLTSDNAENFADVSASDYFASELAIARNTGILNGIGDNRYAPRNHITRQDMMVIVYRALEKLGVEFGSYDEPQFTDFAAVADYAKDAVTALIGADIVNGKSGYIAPEDYTTRAEIAVLTKRILDRVIKKG